MPENWSDLLLNTHKTSLIEILHQHPEDKIKLLDLLLNEKDPVAWRAGWLLSDCLDTDDPIIIPLISDIIHFIPEKSEGQQREWLKILLRMNLNEEQEGKLFDLSTQLWLNPKKQPSIRMYSFRLMLKIAGKHPDLIPEIKVLASTEHAENLSPGVKHSVGLLLKKLN